MDKLAVNQSHFTRCLHCWGINEYTLRASNVNTNIKDEDIYKLAMNNLGEITPDWCELCNMKTAQIEVAYNFKKARTPTKGKDKAKETQL